MDNNQLHKEVRSKLRELGIKFDGVFNFANKGKKTSSFKMACTQRAADDGSAMVVLGDYLNDDRKLISATDILCNLAAAFPNTRIEISQGYGAHLIPYLRVKVWGDKEEK